MTKKVIKLFSIHAKNPETYQVYFETTKSYSYINRSLANIQFIADDVERGASLNAIEHVQLLKQFYDKNLKILPAGNYDYYPLDEYTNWETHNYSDEFKEENEYLYNDLYIVIEKILKMHEELKSFYTKGEF